MLLAFSRCIMSLPLVMNLIPAKTKNIAAIAVAMYLTKLYTFHTGCNIWSNIAVSVELLGGMALAALADNTVVRSIKLAKINISPHLGLWLNADGLSFGFFFLIWFHLRRFLHRI